MQQNLTATKSHLLGMVKKPDSFQEIYFRFLRFLKFLGFLFFIILQQMKMHQVLQFKLPKNLVVS